MTRSLGIWAVVCLPLASWAQGDKDLRAKADGLFTQGAYAEAMPLYSQLVSLNPGDADLSFKYGACSLYGGEDKEKAIGFLKFATQGADPSALAWYFLGRAQHLTYHFKDALASYEHYRGTADKKVIAEHPVDALEQQCRNGQNLLSNLKEIDVHNKVEVEATEFFRFYDLGDIGGKIVVIPDELKTSLDKKSKERSLVYLPGKGGPIYFSSYGKDGRTGRDIYRTELLPTGEFATPVKVAGYINTDQDEDYACMAADGRTLYFCSKGHNSMGGYDVFKSLYDGSNDVFGAPENMDFAVNTPDDDVLYLVDPEGKEACFASGRDSKQGMLHVYRVSTTQTPVNITVLKGTFASQLDEKDRKAHIVVEDAITREQVADVRTDINGSYVLALPRSGKYKFMVEAGPSARTHVGMVEIPRSTEAKAYRQEMTLIDQGGEKLMIKNYFDEPLQDDLIDLALAEITRRAKLDMSTTPKPVEEPVEQPAGDVITQAGFAGDVTKGSAQQMAAEDATELETAAKGYEELAAGAYAVAETNVQEAEAAIAEAKRLVAEAGVLQDEAQKNDRMTQAARERQRSREADLRARSAYAAGQQFDAERMATQQRAITARKVSGDLTTAFSSGNDAAALTALQQLKKRMDEKNGPDNVDLAERMRRNASAAQKEAADKLAQADAQRSEENELKDRISRLEREQGAAGGRKKEDLGKQLDELRDQDKYLQQDVASSFDKARRAQQNAAVATGQVGLAQHLTKTANTTKAAPLSTTAVSALGQRVSGTEERIANVALDERYIDAIAAETEASERKAFDWGTESDEGQTTASAGTQTTARDTTGQAERLASNTVALANDRSNNAALRSGGTAPQIGAPKGDQADAAQAQNANAPANAQNANAATPNGQDNNTAQNSTNTERPATNGAASTNAGTNEHAADAARQNDGTANARPVAAGERGNELASVHGVGVPTEQVVNDDPASLAIGTQAPVDTIAAPVKEATGATATPEEQAFLLANELAELHQLRAAEKDKVQQDSLDARIARVRRQMRATQEPQANANEVAQTERSATAANASEEGNTDSAQSTDSISASGEDLSMDSTNMMKGPPMVFDTTIAEAQLVEQLFATFAEDRARIRSGEGDVRERAQELHGLELMLVDSIDAESERQVYSLEGTSDRPAVLARMDRLRKLKEEHVQQAAQVLADAEQQYAALESRRLEDAAFANANAGGNQPPVTGNDQDAPPTPHNDSYVSIAHGGSERVYESVMDHRSSKVNEAVAMKDRDIEQLTELEEKIDSMETVLEEMPRGKAYDKLRTQTDRDIDDHLIMRTELGQRMAYITKEEYAAAKDSADELRNAVTKMGLPPGEPLLQMAQHMEEDARTAMDLAGVRRKEADRSENIVLRDSLYREAYGLELQALRELDRQMTVRNHILSDRFKAGEAPSYAEIERRMFGKPDDLAWQRTEAGTMARTVGADSTASAHAATADQPRPDYKTYLRPDGKAIEPQPAASDSSSLTLPSQQQATQARTLEQRSVAAADSANAAQDSAVVAERHDRERIEREAARLRHVSDSLHAAALAGEQRARDQEQQERTVAEKAAFAERLRQYYYLSNEEQATVMNAEDQSRYFGITAKALDQRAQATAAQADAGNDRTLANALKEQAASLRGDTSASGRDERSEQVRHLDARSSELEARADSLAQHADLLGRAAKVNESQAALVLQGLPAERSSAIMALEQRARRTEPSTAEARAAAPASDQPANTARPADAAAPNTATRSEPTRTNGRSSAEASTPPPAPTRTVASNTSNAAAPAGLPASLPALTADEFSLDASPATRQGAIPIDAPMPAGVVFKVQVGAFRNRISDQAFNDMTPVTGETVGNGLTRYTAGMFTNGANAAKASEQLRARGYRDAFVVAYQDGRRIPVSQAMALVSPATAQAVPARPATPVQQPSALPSIQAAAPEDAAVLNNYAASAQEVLASFKPSVEATSYYNDPTAAPANQVEMIKGLFFTVQVGVYSKPTALDKLFNITPLNSERTEAGKIRYTTGVFLDLENARVRKDATVGLGVKDAFITAYLNGKRIPMRDARALLARFGTAILADPSTLKR